MNEDELSDQITAELEKGIREMVELRNAEPFKRAAVEAYRVRTGGKALVEEEQILNHVFPGDVGQTLALSLEIIDNEREKASVLMKGALEQVLSRLAVVPDNQWQKKSPSWKFWKRD